MPDKKNKSDNENLSIDNDQLGENKNNVASGDPQQGCGCDSNKAKK